MTYSSVVNLALELVHIFVGRDVGLVLSVVLYIVYSSARPDLCGKSNARNEPSGVSLGPILTFHQPLSPLLVERCASHGPIEVDMTINVELLVQVVKVSS